MVRCAALQDDQAEMMNRNALHALMGLEATPIKAGGFKYIHRDTGLIFEIAPATPDSAGAKAPARVTKAKAIFMLLCCLAAGHEDWDFQSQTVIAVKEQCTAVHAITVQVARQDY